MQGLINKLKHDRYTAVSVESVDGFDKPYINFTLSKILENFSSVENFFNEVRKNYPTYRFIEKRQNGTKSGIPNYKTIGPVHQNEFQNPIPDLVQPPVTGLGTPMGLGVAELIDLNINKHEKVRLEIENQYLKAENERLKKVEEEFKEHKLQVQYSDKKSEGTQNLITEALSSPVALALIEKFTAPKVAGLASPEQTDQFIKVYNTLDENSKNLFKNILYLAQSKQGFFDTLVDIVEMELKN